MLARKPIVIKHLIRLGKFSQSSHPRPLLVKFSSIWDRKLLLIRRRNLKDYRIGHLFLRKAVPPDHALRQKRSNVQFSSSPPKAPISAFCDDNVHLLPLYSLRLCKIPCY